MNTALRELTLEARYLGFRSPLWSGGIKKTRLEKWDSALGSDAHSFGAKDFGHRGVSSGRDTWGSAACGGDAEITDSGEANIPQILTHNPLWEDQNQDHWPTWLWWSSGFLQLMEMEVCRTSLKRATLGSPSFQTFFIACVYVAVWNKMISIFFTQFIKKYNRKFHWETSIQTLNLCNNWLFEQFTQYWWDNSAIIVSIVPRQE